MPTSNKAMATVRTKLVSELVISAKDVVSYMEACQTVLQRGTTTPRRTVCTPTVKTTTTTVPRRRKEWIQAVEQSLLLDAPFDEDNFAKYQMVRNIAIDMHKLRRANDYINEKGVVHRDKTVGYTDDGQPIKMDEENVLNISYDRLNRTLTRQLKELGILDDPDSKQAEATESIATELSRLRRERGTDE